MKKFFTILFSVIIIGLLIFGYVWFYVPFSDAGVKAGILNNIKHKGIIFKTYEGELVQSGFSPGTKGLQSNDFQFSIEDEAIAKKLMSMGGQQVKLHYKEYYGRLPWRGYSKFIVDSIIDATPNVEPMNQTLPIFE